MEIVVTRKFQFYLSSIKRLIIAIGFFIRTSFNSTLVQLKDNTNIILFLDSTSFNSTLVQLKAPASISNILLYAVSILP